MFFMNPPVVVAVLSFLPSLHAHVCMDWINMSQIESHLGLVLLILNCVQGFLCG